MTNLDGFQNTLATPSSYGQEVIFLPSHVTEQLDEKLVKQMLVFNLIVTLGLI